MNTQRLLPVDVISGCLTLIQKQERTKKRNFKVRIILVTLLGLGNSMLVTEILSILDILVSDRRSYMNYNLILCLNIALTELPLLLFN